MGNTPVTKKTKSTAATLLTLSLVAELVGLGTNKWVQLGAWLLMLIGFLCLWRGIKKKGY